MELLIQGDLNQMITQQKFLSAFSITMRQHDIYFYVKESDVKKALQLIYDNKVEGWWHYQEDYEKFNIATNEEFQNRLENQINEKRSHEYNSLPLCKHCKQKVRTIFFPTHVNEQLEELSLDHEPEPEV